VRTAWLAAGTVVALGLGARFAVLRGLGSREIG
jgi:hypothetical protein